MVAVIFVGLVLTLGIIFQLKLKNQPESGVGLLVANTVVSHESENIDAGLPVRLTVPGISVDSRVESVGLAFDGTMDTPKGSDAVAWFHLGQRPGKHGSAVITGHSGVWKNGEETVFNNLHRLHKGDKLYIEDAGGMITAFVVRETRIYDQNADTSEVFHSDDGKSHLNLITCEGVWDKVSKSYPGRLVVFTDKV